MWGDMETLETDYLVVGSGAVGMAFVDTMLDETDATFVIVDRHHLPGGHWNDAYPFVRLHQPSASYGVPSARLGSDHVDEVGSNKGFYELASGAEVISYFEKVMRERFLPTGRVRYFPMSDYLGDGRFRALLSGKDNEVVARKTVDSTFFQTSVPSTHKRKFAVADSVACVAPNELPRRAANYQRFTILGAGKTGMDAAVWLLDNGADPNGISWVCPRDSWLMNRSTTQPGDRFFKEAIGGFADTLEACAAATSSEDLFERLEAVAAMLRIDRAQRPTMFHYATISTGEIEQLRRIKNVLRNGRVAAIEPDRLTFANGDTIAAAPDTLYVDCTATAVNFGAKAGPVFDGDRITLQSVRSPLLPFSASIIAFVEANYPDDETKNNFTKPVVLSDTPYEWMKSTLGNMMNQHAWSQEPRLDQWIANCRLNAIAQTARDADRSDPEKMKILGKLREFSPLAAANLQKLIVAEAA